MPLTAKTLIILLFVLTLASGIVGAYIYFSYVGPVEKLEEGNIPTLSQVLDRIDEIEYSITVNETSYIVKLDNDPGTRSGVAELYYANGTLVYKIKYKYSDELLESVTTIYPNGTTKEENPQVYEPYFKTGIYLRLAGQKAEMGPAPGIGPAYLIYYLTDELDIDWRALTSPRGGQPSQLVDINVVPSDVEFMGETVRGVTLGLIPTNPLFSPTVWGMPEYTIDLVVANDIVVAPYYKLVLTLQTGEYTAEVKLTSISFS